MDSIPHTSGVYQILCIPTGKVYIGSAINLRSRQSQHFTALRRGTHKNPHLQSAWNKHGGDAFEFSVIELVLASFVTDREQYYINKHRATNRKYGFNQAPEAGSVLGYKHSDASRANMSASAKKRQRVAVSDEARQHMSEAKRGTKYKPHTAEARQAKSDRQKGRVLSEETRQKIADKAKNRAIPPATRAAQKAAVSKQWVVTDPCGNEFRVTGLAAFCREHKLVPECMSAVARGVTTHHKGWKCRYP